MVYAVDRRDGDHEPGDDASDAGYKTEMDAAVARSGAKTRVPEGFDDF